MSIESLLALFLHIYPLTIILISSSGSSVGSSFPFRGMHAWKQGRSSSTSHRLEATHPSAEIRVGYWSEQTPEMI